MDFKSYTFKEALPNSKAVVRWDNLKMDEQGSPFFLSKHYPLSVVVEGNFGAAEVVLEGSCSFDQDAPFSPLKDAQGDTILIGTGGIRSVGTDCLYIRPRVIGGTGRTDLTVNLLIYHTR